MNLQFSENVKKFRTERGYTQSELAVLLSVSPQAVSRWENGQAYPDIELLPRLAEYLCVSIDKLMGAEKLTEAMLNEELYERFDARTKKGYKDPENEMRILDLYRELGGYKA
jgi:transcriptional regulator with XRE-family HTH domain